MKINISKIRLFLKGFLWGIFSVGLFFFLIEKTGNIWSLIKLLLLSILGNILINIAFEGNDSPSTSQT